MADQAVIEHEVEKILAKRFNPRRKIHEYLVKWDKVPYDQNSWEPFTHLGNVKHLVDIFEVQLAKQKEQRGLKQAAAASVKPTPAPAPPIRQDRNAKTNALDQVSKWLTDEDGIGKRKNPDDSDYSDEEDISELDVSSPKKAKQQSTVKPPVRNIGPTTKQLQIQQLQMTSSLPGMMSFILF
jgi:hypothetical protein